MFIYFIRDLKLGSIRVLKLFVKLHVHLYCIKVTVLNIVDANTIDVERLAGKNVHGFNPTKVFVEILCAALARNTYYLV